MSNRIWTEIYADLVCIEVAPQNWPIDGQWRVRVWHERGGTSAFSYEKFDSREEAHEYAKTVEVVVHLGRSSVGIMASPEEMDREAASRHARFNAAIRRRA